MLGKGWDSDPRYTYIGRRSGVWGNPYKPPVFSRAECISKYESYVRDTPELLAKLPELAYKHIVCHCRPLPCHGDVLIRLVSELV